MFNVHANYSRLELVLGALGLCYINTFHIVELLNLQLLIYFSRDGFQQNDIVDGQIQIWRRKRDNSKKAFLLLQLTTNNKSILFAESNLIFYAEEKYRNLCLVRTLPTAKCEYFDNVLAFLGEASKNKWQNKLLVDWASERKMEMIRQKKYIVRLKTNFFFIVRKDESMRNGFI